MDRLVDHTPVPFAVMVSRGTGDDISALARGRKLYVGNPHAKPLVRKLWEEVEALLEHTV